MKQEGFIFVLMPFSNDFDDVYKYGIKQTANELGFYCERVDEQNFKGSILSQIYNQINKADVIIADLSTKNPNVYYEIGYAHAKDKHVILLTNSAEDIPFDLKHYPHIIYDKIQGLSQSLEAKLEWFKTNQYKRNDVSGFVQFYNRGIDILETGKLTLEIWENDHPFIEDEKEKEKHFPIYFQVDLYNSGNSMSDEISEIGIVFNSKFSESRLLNQEENNILRLPNEEVLITYDNIQFIYPSSWKSISIYIGRIYDLNELPNKATLRIFKEYGIQNIPVTIDYKYVKPSEIE